MLCSFWALLHIVFQLFYIKNKKGRGVVLAVRNGRVISLAEVPWGKEHGAVQRHSLTFVCSGGGSQTLVAEPSGSPIASLMLFYVGFELLRRLEK